MTQAIKNSTFDRNFRFSSPKPAKKEPGRMLITQSHFEYYRQKKAPVPSWSEEFVEKERKVSVHQLINAQGQTTTKRPSYVLHNTLNVLSSQRRRGQLRQGLRTMSVRPGCTDRPERRAAHCKKWLARLEQND